MNQMSNLVPAAGSAGAENHAATSSARPRSAVSAGVGIVGLIGLVTYLLSARYAPEIASFLGVDWRGRGALRARTPRSSASLPAAFRW